jgi:hypothetical protein
MRFTIRRMMLAIAVFALTLYIGLSYRQSGEYRRQAQFYSKAQKAALVRARNVESGAAILHGYTLEEKKRTVDYARRSAVIFSRLRAKYERAVLLPWFPLEGDEPLP